MSGPPGPPTASKGPPGRNFLTSALLLPGSFALPLRQEVTLPVRPPPQVFDAIRSVLSDAHFEILTFVVPAPPDGGEAGWAGFRAVGERALKAAPMSAAGKVSVYTLLAAGIGLGIFDAVAIGVWWVALPWSLGALCVAALTWYRYGRGFESDVVVVTIRPAVGAGGPTVVWMGGRVRSDVRAGDRTANSASAQPRVARDLGTLVRNLSAAVAAGSAG